MFIFLEERRIGLDVKQHSVYRFVKRVKCFNIVFTKIYDIPTSANNWRPCVLLLVLSEDVWSISVNTLKVQLGQVVIW
jgi:hypothetical protein